MTILPAEQRREGVKMWSVFTFALFFFSSSQESTKEQTRILSLLLLLLFELSLSLFGCVCNTNRRKKIQTSEIDTHWVGEREGDRSLSLSLGYFDCVQNQHTNDHHYQLVIFTILLCSPSPLSP